MQRFIKTLFLAFVILIGGWALFNRHQIHSIGDAISLASYQLGSRTFSNEGGLPLIRTSDYLPEYGALPGEDRFAQNGGQFQHGGQYQSGGQLSNDQFQTGQSQSNQIPPKSRLPRFQRSVGQQNALEAQPIATRRSSAASRHIASPISRLPRTDGRTVRIASFKLESRSGQGDLRRTTDICEQFDVVSIQNKSGISISKLVGELNRRGNDYRFVDKGPTNQKFTIIFNRQSVILDGQHWYTVNDPEDLFEHEPLVAWFRARNAHPEEAFTFTLVNVQLNERRPDGEIGHLGELFRAIRLDGRQEDDIILAGDFQSSDRQLKKLQTDSQLNSAIVGVATNTRNDMQLDNLLFDPKATIEYSGDSGVFDFLKRFNMTLESALSISNRMPVWAEFAVIEGHSPGRAAESHEVFGSTSTSR